MGGKPSAAELYPGYETLMNNTFTTLFNRLKIFCEAELHQELQDYLDNMAIILLRLITFNKTSDIRPELSGFEKVLIEKFHFDPSFASTEQKILQTLLLNCCEEFRKGASAGRVNIDFVKEVKMLKVGISETGVTLKEAKVIEVRGREIGVLGIEKKN